MPSNNLNHHRVLTRFLCCLLLASVMTPSYAGSKAGDYALIEVMGGKRFEKKVGAGVKFYFGEQKTPRVKQHIITLGASGKAGKFNKSKIEACQDAFYEAMSNLRDRAIDHGGNAVVDVRSNVNQVLVSSTTHFKCAVGMLSAEVVFQGTVAKI